MKRTREGELKADGEADSKEAVQPEKKKLRKDLKPAEVLSRLILRRIIKENHASPIKQIAFNFTKLANSNLVATVGGNQASVYDNEHGVAKNAGHLDLMINYVNPGKKAELNTCAWLGDLDPDDEGQDTDTYLAVGSNDSLIHIISIARCRVICVLQGHKGAVIDLAVHPQRSGCLLSVGADNTVRLWDCRNPYGEPEKSCLATFETSAIVATFSPEGTRFVTGGSGGALREWAIPGEYLDDEEEKTIGRTITECKLLPKKHRVDVDCVRAVGGHYVSKDIEGKIVVWQAMDSEIVRTIRVPDCRLNSRSRFDVSEDGEFLCAGNSAGAVFIYDLHEGTLISKLQSGRSKHPAHGCVFSRHCQHVALVCAEPFIYRWSMPDETEETIAAAAKEEKEKADEDAKDESAAEKENGEEDA